MSLTAWASRSPKPVLLRAQKFSKLRARPLSPLQTVRTVRRGWGRYLRLRTIHLAPRYRLAALAKPQATFHLKSTAPPAQRMHDSGGCGEGREERGGGSSRPWWGREQVGGRRGDSRWKKEGKQHHGNSSSVGKYHRWALLIAWGGPTAPTNLPGKGDHREQAGTCRAGGGAWASHRRRGPSLPHQLPCVQGCGNPAGGPA